MKNLLITGDNIFACYPCIKSWMSGMDELSQGLKYTLECHGKKLNKPETNKDETKEKEKEEEETIAVHATLFLSQHQHKNNISQAIDSLLENLKVSSIDCLYVAFHPLSTESERKQLWHAVVNLCYAEGKTKTLAVRDLNKQQLEWLMNITPQSPPVAISVSLQFANENEDLVSFAQLKNIEVRTHGDTNHLKTFSEDTMQEFVNSGKFPFLNNHTVEIEWAISYGVIVTNRQVVKRQSFMFHLALTPIEEEEIGRKSNGMPLEKKQRLQLTTQ